MDLHWLLIAFSKIYQTCYQSKNFRNSPPQTSKACYSYKHIARCLWKLNRSHWNLLLEPAPFLFSLNMNLRLLYSVT